MPAVRILLVDDGDFGVMLFLQGLLSTRFRVEPILFGCGADVIAERAAQIGIVVMPNWWLSRSDYIDRGYGIIRACSRANAQVMVFLHADPSNYGKYFLGLLKETCAVAVHGPGILEQIEDAVPVGCKAGASPW